MIPILSECLLINDDDTLFQTIKFLYAILGLK